MLLNKPSAVVCGWFFYIFKFFFNVSTALLRYAKGVLFFRFMSTPPPLRCMVENYSLIIMEFAWDVDTCFAAFYKAENNGSIRQAMVVKFLQGRSKLINH